MTDTNATVPARPGWQPLQVYIAAAFCLILGTALGYLFRGSASPAVAASNRTTAMPAPSSAAPQMPSLEQMKQMADKQAEPLLVQLKKTPGNADLLAKVGRVYESAHQFKDAAQYYGQSLQIDRQNVALRNEMASCLYYTGDVDGALAQFEQSLKFDSTNPNALFNLGMIRWQGKKDPKGAVAAWQQLLKSNPGLEAQKKDQVRRMIADASQTSPSRATPNKD
jgi:cytochrome c-type biogenesis protein CcmH/NrfG